MPGSRYRVIDMVALWVGFVVAVVVGLPILAITLLVASGLAAALGAMGVGGETVQGLLVGVGGFGGGLVLVFLVLLWLSRRLPARIRTFVYEDEPSEPDDVARQDPDADRTTLQARVSTLDASLMERESRQARPDPEDEPPSSG